MKTLFLLFLSVISASAASCPALPGLVNSPCTITSDGAYLLSANIDGSSLPNNQPAIEVGPGVVAANINCNGHFIVNNAAPFSNYGVGIGGASVANVEIVNCAFAGSGLAHCVHFDNAPSGWVYQNITVRDSVCSATWRGIFIRSHGTKVLNTYVVNVGGHTNCLAGGYYTFAIEFYGYNAEIKNNRIRRVWNRCFEEVVGISASGYAVNAVISDNHIENDKVFSEDAIAVWVGWSAGSNLTITGNKLRKWNYGYLAGYVAGGLLSGTALVEDVSVPVTGFDPPNWIVLP